MPDKAGFQERTQILYRTFLLVLSIFWTKTVDGISEFSKKFDGIMT